MASEAAKYYGLGDPWVLRRLDELQLFNRLSDLPKLQKLDRQNIGLAVWGPAKKSDDDRQPRGGRGGRR